MDVHIALLGGFSVVRDGVPGTRRRLEPPQAPRPW